MSRFSGAEILGGVAVTIGADLDALRAGVAESRRIAADAERTIGIRVPLMLADTGARLGAELNRVIASMQTIASARPIRIPVILEPVGGGGGGSGGGFPSGGGGGSRMARPGEITIGGPPGLPGDVNSGGGLRALPPPSIEADSADADSPARVWRMRYRPGLGATVGNPNFTTTGGGLGGAGTATIGAGAGEGAIGGGGDVGGGGGTVVIPPAGGGGGARPRAGRRGGMQRSIRALFIAHAAAQALNTAADIAEYQRISQTGTLEEAETARVRAIGSIRGIPIAGTAGQSIGTLSNDLGGSPLDPFHFLSGIRTLRTGVARISGKMTDEEDEQARREQERADRIADANFANRSARSSRFISQRDQLRAVNETIGMSTTGRGVFEARQALSDFDAGAPSGQLKGAAKEARQELGTALANAIRKDAAAAAAELASARIGAAGSSLGGATAIVGATRGTAIAGRMGLVGGIAQQSAEIQNAIDTLRGQGVSDSDPQIVGLKLQLEAQQGAGAQRVAAHDINDIRSSRRRNVAFGVGQLRRTATMLGNTSDVNDIDIADRHRGDIYEAEDTYGPNSTEAGRARFERDQEQADTRRERLTQEGRRRRLAAHNAFIDVPREQAEIDRRFAVNMGTRTAVAGAQSANEPILAGIIPLIAEMKEEMRMARVDQRPALARTQSAELSAERSRLLRPNQYAVEGDRLRDIPGGPGGQSGKDLIDALKELTKALTDAQGIASGGALPN